MNAKKKGAEKWGLEKGLLNGIWGGSGIGSSWRAGEQAGADGDDALRSNTRTRPGRRAALTRPVRLVEGTEREAKKKRKKKKMREKRRPHRAAPKKASQKSRALEQSRASRKVQGESLGRASERLFDFSRFRLATVRSRRSAGWLATFFFFFFFQPVVEKSKSHSRPPQSRKKARLPKVDFSTFSAQIPRRTPWPRSRARSRLFRLFHFSTFRLATVRFWTPFSGNATFSRKAPRGRPRSPPNSERRLFEKKVQGGRSTLTWLPKSKSLAPHFHC